MKLNNTYNVYDNCTRNSGDSNVPWVCSGYTYLGILLTVVPCVITMFTIVFGNTLVLLAVFRDHKMLKQLNNWYVVSLAVADLFVGTFIMPFTLAQEVMGFWYFGTIACEVWIALDVLFVTASILNICAIGIDRFWAVTYPTAYRQKRTGCWVRIMIAIAWIMSLIICFPPVVGWRSERRLGECEVSTNLSYVIYSACGSFYIPVTILLMVYTQIHFITQKISKEKLSQAAKTERTLAISSQWQGKSSCGVVSHRTNIIGNRSSAVQLNEKSEVVDLVTKSVMPRSKSETPICHSACTSPDKFRTFSLLEPDIPGVSWTTKSNKEETTGPVEQDSIRPIAISVVCKEPLEVDDASDLTSSRKSLPPQTRRNTEIIQKSSGFTTVLSPEVLASLTTKRKMLKRKERKATLILGLILGGFIFCWFPFFSIYIIRAMCIQYSFGDVPPLLFKVLFWLGYCNSALNPLIYTVFNNEFKKAVKKILRIRN